MNILTIEISVCPFHFSIHFRVSRLIIMIFLLPFFFRIEITYTNAPIHPYIRMHAWWEILESAASNCAQKESNHTCLWCICILRASACILFGEKNTQRRERENVQCRKYLSLFCCMSACFVYYHLNSRMKRWEIESQTLCNKNKTMPQPWIPFNYFDENIFVI